MAKARTPAIYIVSDGRGETGTQLVRAALVQFDRQPCRWVRNAEVRTDEQVKRIVEQARTDRAVIFYTLVGDETRKAIQRYSGRQLVPTVDLLGPALIALHDLFQRNPGHRPGLLYASDRERFDRYEAIDYTLKHDDGQRPHELNRADVVIVGVSRAAKSSTCFYLAYRGIKAANVPLIPNIPLPTQLLKLDPSRVVGLRVNVNRLRGVREARAETLRLDPEDDYTDKRAIAREVLAANAVMDEHGWQCVEASYLATEEIAREVMKSCGLEQRLPG